MKWAKDPPKSMQDSSTVIQKISCNYCKLYMFDFGPDDLFCVPSLALSWLFTVKN